ncbi:hypothetical protein RN001_008930 [Aquatica leii]|uniref:Uncharacterized protein n=1 Tax=Aquatica leii TaxID=1421715 RepID=A0AAN7SHN6_9COLE|nr:hypothetical protein RN001_008930 [Aquatica leii]
MFISSVSTVTSIFAPFLPVVDYFEDTWIGRPDRRNRRRTATFPHIIWNCFNSAMTGLPKTNNVVEGWHRSFECHISASHPSI